jgi:hypothetical protein
MSNFMKLADKANNKGCRLLIRFDPQEHGEEWGVKFYPDEDDDGHYYAYNSDLDAACHQLLDELQGFSKW